MNNPAELEHEALAMFKDWLDAACKTDFSTIRSRARRTGSATVSFPSG
jgi:hypothetical protein